MQRDAAFDTPVPAQPGVFPFLTLPFEIRLKIYGILFSRSSPIHPRSITSFGSGNLDGTGLIRPGQSVMRLPVELFRVNHQVYEKASTVLWSENRILLMLPLGGGFETRHAFCGLRQYGKVAVDIGCMPRPDQLQKIRELDIEIYATRPIHRRLTDSFHPNNRVLQRELSVICEALQKSHNLQHLEIRLTNWHGKRHVHDCFKIAHGVLAPGGVGAPLPVGYNLVCCNLFGHRIFGKLVTRVGEIQTLCEQAIEVDQQILAPLGELRGVAKVEINGRVTDKWARHLEKSIRSAVGVDIVPFEHGSAIIATADIQDSGSGE
jgi:hypothetical protein